MQFGVAVLEDDVELRDEILVPRLVNSGFRAEGFGSSAELYRRMIATSFELFVLDVKLRGENGLDIARYLRESAPIGVVMHTRGGSDADRIHGLTRDVDAWLAKPVEIELLAATLHAVGRRLRQDVISRTHAPVSTLWRLADADWRLCAPNGLSVPLNLQERRLLTLLFAAENQLVTHAELLADLATIAENYDRHRLETLIHRLRRKVNIKLGLSLPLRSVRGSGYVLLSNDERAQER